MNLLKKPVYSVYPHIYCSGTIMVNDVPVIDWYGKETKEGGYSGSVPINHALLQSGTYEVVGTMLPREGKQTLTSDETLFIDFYLAEADKDKWKASRHKFHPKIESPWDGLSKGIKHPAFKIKTTIEVELPFTLDGWQNSLDLRHIKEETLFNEVLKFYFQLHGVLASHNAARFLELSKDKMKLQEEAFYYSKAHKANFISGASALFDQKLELLPLDPTQLRLQIMGYGKLVRLIKLDGSAALQYKTPNPDVQDNVEFEVKLHMRTENSGLSII